MNEFMLQAIKLSRAVDVLALRISPKDDLFIEPFMARLEATDCKEIVTFE